jgi:hypothetical protein
MLKVMALLRTVFLVFIVAFTVRSLPYTVDVARTFDEQYARYAMAVAQLQRACWYAIGWITFETAVGWWMATRRKPAAATPAAARSAPSNTGVPH